jgi:receptor-type tyrosine-protein phosphatase beta
MSGPSSPFIEVVKPIPGGLNISWRTDVNSKQEKYVVIYTRNDTDRSVFFKYDLMVVLT